MAKGISNIFSRCNKGEGNKQVPKTGKLNSRKCTMSPKAKKATVVAVVVMAILAIVAVTVLTHYGFLGQQGQNILNNKIFTAFKSGYMTVKDAMTTGTTPLWAPIVSSVGTMCLLGAAAGIYSIHQHRKNKAEKVDQSEGQPEIQPRENSKV